MSKRKARLLHLEVLELHPRLLKAIQEGNNVSAVYNELPLEELLVLDSMLDKYPGLRWVLRKQRDNHYVLTVLRGHHLEKPEVKGEP